MKWQWYKIQDSIPKKCFIENIVRTYDCVCLPQSYMMCLFLYFISLLLNCHQSNHASTENLEENKVSTRQTQSISYFRDAVNTVSLNSRTWRRQKIAVWFTHYLLIILVQTHKSLLNHFKHWCYDRGHL